MMNPNQAPCIKCGAYISRVNIARHLQRCGNKKATLEPQRSCPYCSNSVTLSNFKRHLKKCNPNHLKRKNEETIPSTSKKACLDSHATPSSSTIVKVRPSLVSSINTAEATLGEAIRGSALEIKEIETAFKGRLKTYYVENNLGMKDPAAFLQIARELLRGKIMENSKEKNLKVNLIMLVDYKKSVSNNKDEIQQMNFKTKNKVILPTTIILEYLKAAEIKILAEMDEFYAKGSGWTLSKIIGLELRVNNYIPLRGSSYMMLPMPIANKKAILNIHNNDHKCFLWSVLAGVHPIPWQDNAYKLHHYKPYEHEFDSYLQGISFPVSLEHVQLFEKRSGISINVYAYDDKFVIYPLLITNDEKQLHVDLLYMKNETTSHYCLIRDLSRLIRSQITKCDKKTWVCRRCLQHFTREDSLQKHKRDCRDQDPIRIKMPKHGSKLTFNEGNKSLRVPFVGYADFECMLTSIGKEEVDEKFPIGPRRKFTEKYQKHEAISFSYYIVYSEGDYGQPVKYFGPDASQVFVNSLLDESRKIHHLYSSAAAKPMEIGQDDTIAIANAIKCHICEKPFTTLEDYMVRDHDHLTGKFRGVAHNTCNLKFRKPQFIPIFIHNLSGYDTHLFIKMFGLNDETISVIPNNEERYISYTVEIENGIKLRFLDSCRFLSSSLDTLAKNLSLSQFNQTSKYYSGEQMQLLVKKGIYPYDFMDSLEKYHLTSLPDKQDFYNRLNMANIEDEEYEHARDVWTKFNIRNMEEYTLLYNQTDVLLLADIMENFRDLCMKTYHLDPAWYFTAPGLAWSAMLRTTSIELELLTDNEMRLMIAKGIRGGVSQCSNRHALANNPYMAEEYDNSKPTSYLMYLDANNLYGWAMSQTMPYANFQWVEDPSSINVTDISDDSETGYILEVDLEYPRNLHDLHADMPLAPEQRVPPGSKEKKLLLTLFDKEEYVLHYRNLKQYLSLGMRLRKIHRAISFSQSKWIKNYIDLNTDMRTKAKNEFEKDFFKLMNNSVFGKTMENILNRVDIRLATKEKQVDKWMAQPNFKSRTIYTENLAAIHMSKTRLLFNKPIYVGMSILDVSKTLMFDFHYNTVKKKYGENAQLQYTDTDSLTYLISTADVYNDMKEMIDLLDTSDYPEPNRYSIPRENKKVIGKFKDELRGRVMFEHVGLRSKMYASRSEVDPKKPEEGGIIKKSKGVKMVVVKKDITFEDYKDCLLNFARQYNSLNVTTGNRTAVTNHDCVIYRSVNMIRSYNHDLYSIELNKIALSAKDDKRFILDGGIKTLPWGHYSIEEDTKLDHIVDTLLVE